MALSTTVIEYFGHQPTNGNYGVEVEVEGNNLPVEVGNPWESKEDHSLRGEAREYIFRRPIRLAACSEAISKLELRLTEPGVKVKDSRRTSVHVHRNMLTNTVREVYNLIALYYIFEIPMTEFAGPSRVGNMYCLRGIDAEFLPFQITASLQTGNLLRAFRHRDDIRYSGLNLCALGNFGSVEFRAFRGTIRTDEIMPWLDIIEALHKGAVGFKDPQEISSTFFDLGPTRFLETYMPPDFTQHVKSFTDYEDTMMVGHQYTFEIAHAIADWHADVEPVPMPKKPKWLLQDAQNVAEQRLFNMLNVPVPPMPDWAAVPARRRRNEAVVPQPWDRNAIPRPAEPGVAARGFDDDDFEAVVNDGWDNEDEENAA